MPINLLTLAVETPWAMEERALSGLLEIARTRTALPDRYPDWCTWEGRGDERAVMLQGGKALPGASRVVVRDGVAVVPVYGPIFRRANMLTELSGATSLDTLGRDLQAAMDADAVKAVLLDVDSPGGQASGISELASTIAAMKGKKPIHCYVGGTGASAAYWLASACDTITVSTTAILGSIGVMAAYAKESGEEITLVSSQSPKKRPDLETDEGKAEVLKTLDSLASVFVGDVARYRGVDTQTVLSEFGQGGVLVGKAAVKAGMADRTGTFEGTLRRLATGSPLQRPGMRAEESEEPTCAAEPPVIVCVTSEGAPDALSFEDQLHDAHARVQSCIDRADGYQRLSRGRWEDLCALQAALEAVIRKTEPRAEFDREGMRTRLLRSRHAVQGALAGS